MFAEVLHAERTNRRQPPDFILSAAQFCCHPSVFTRTSRRLRHGPASTSYTGTHPTRMPRLIPLRTSCSLDDWPKPS